MIRRIFNWRRDASPDSTVIERPSGKDVCDQSMPQERPNAGAVGTDRRHFLLRAGKYAAYTSPIIYALLSPKGSIYAQSGGGSCGASGGCASGGYGSGG